MLPAVGTISYNGITFTGACRHRITATPVYDEAGRTVVYTVYRLAVNDYILHATDAGTSTEAIRRALQKPGQALTYTGTGFGDLSVNANGGSLNPTAKADVVWGPKPTQVNFTPVGTPRAWRIEWVCEVAIPECTTARYRNRVLAFNYEVDYSIDESGFTTRTYTGYLEIPMTRFAGGRLVPDSADLYREKVNPPLMPGFKREPGKFHVSKDKRRLDFTIVDREVPIGSLPEGCTSATGNVSVSNVSPMNTNQWMGRISASYSLPRLQSKVVAWERFFQLLEDRLRVVKDAKAEPLIYNFSLNEGVYANDRELSFEVSYLFTMPIEVILRASGIWRAVPGTQWSRWAASMAGVLGPRGSAGLYNRPDDDAIIDLCLTENPTLLGGGANPPPTKPPNTTRTLKGGGAPETSWIMYKCWIEMDGDPGTVSMKTLPSKSGGGNPAPEVIAFNAPTGGDRSGADIVADAVVNMFGSKPLGASMTAGQRNWLYLNRRDVYLQDLIATKDANFLLREQILKLLASGSREVAKQTQEINEAKHEPVQIEGSARLNSKLTGGGGNDSQIGRSGTIIQQRNVRKFYCRLMGEAMRAGFPIPIPSITEVGGATAIPRPGHRPKVTQQVAANWGGKPIYHATWAIPYELDKAPDGNIPYPANPFLAMG